MTTSEDMIKIVDDLYQSFVDGKTGLAELIETEELELNRYSAYMDGMLASLRTTDVAVYEEHREDYDLFSKKWPKELLPRHIEILRPLFESDPLNEELGRFYYVKVEDNKTILASGVKLKRERDLGKVQWQRVHLEQEIEQLVLRHGDKLSAMNARLAALKAKEDCLLKELYHK